MKSNPKWFMLFLIGMIVLSGTFIAYFYNLICEKRGIERQSNCQGMLGQVDGLREFRRLEHFIR